MTVVKFYIEDGKLKLEDVQASIIRNSTDTVLSFDFTDDWGLSPVWCLINTPDLDRETHRLEVEITSEGNIVELPPQLTDEIFLKISLYSVFDGNRMVTNKVILPIDEGGYHIHHPHHHHDKYPHQGKYHHHHCFPFRFYPAKTRHPYHPHLGSPKSPWGDSYRPKCRGKFGRHGERLCHEPPKDIFGFVLEKLGESVNHFEFIDDKFLAYHDGELLEILPFPPYVTKEYLDEKIQTVEDSGNVTINKMDIDSELSDESTNAVENRVVKSINDRVTNIEETRPVIVVLDSELPETGETNKVYLLPVGEDNFDEYIWNGAKYICIGCSKLELENYIKKSELKNHVGAEIDQNGDFYLVFN